MAWGFFKKVADTAVKGAKTLKESIIPVGKKVVGFAKDIYDIAEPILDETTWGKRAKQIIDASDDVMDYAENVNDVVNAKDFKSGFKRSVDLYSRSKAFR